MRSHEQIESTKSSDTDAIRWSAISKYSAQLLQTAISLLMAGLLAPEHFGLLGIATLYSQFAKTICNVGLRAKIVQSKMLDQLLISTVFWMNAAMCLLLGLLVVLSSWFIAYCYQEPSLTPLISTLSLTIFANIFTVVPSALLQRQMDFKSLAIREIGCVVLSGLVGIAMAIAGAGVWALVASAITNSLSQAIILYRLCPARVTFTFDKQIFWEILRFGLSLTGSDIFRFATRNSDVAIIGAMLGPVALGYYSFGKRLTTVLSDAITQIVGRVLFPKLSRIQEDNEASAGVVSRAAKLICFVAIPLLCVLTIFAEPVVRTVFQEKWLPAVPLVWYLAPGSAFMCLMPIPTNLLLARGRTDVLLKCNVATGLGTLLVTGFAATWGLTEMAIAITVAQISSVLLCLHIGCRLTTSSTIQPIVEDILRILALSAVPIALGYITFLSFTHLLSLGYSGAIGVLVAISLFAAGTFLFFKSEVRILMKLMFLERLLPQTKATSRGR